MPSEYYSIDALLADESFVRYALFNASEYKSQWESYIQKNPDQQPIIREAQQTLALLYESLKENEVEEQLQQLKRLITEHKMADDSGSGENMQRMRVFRIKRILPYAAAAVVIAILTLGIIQIFHQRKTVPEVVNVSSIPVTWQTYTCAVGGRKTITLPDGTFVILNSNSTLRVPDNFNQNGRHVLLDGAAFFDVAYHAQKPFKVSAKNLVTIDIGTSFLVRAYDYEPDISVLLLSGKVRVETRRHNGNETSHNSIELNPGQKLSFDKSNGQLQTGTFDISGLESWKAGKMSFNNASFDEVLRQLQLWYGMKFEIQGKEHKTQHFTGEFTNENLDNVLKVISFSMNCHYKIEGNKVIMAFYQK